MTRVWVCGARGMLGRALTGRLQELHVETLTSGREVDVCDAAALAAFARRERPTHVINATGYTRVDDAETAEELARAINAVGAENVARAALEVGARFVHVSSDYVFDGNATEPYREEAATNPLSAYGRSKLEGERRVAGVDPTLERTYLVRTSWLFGEHGKNFVQTILALLATRNELRVVADQWGRPTYTRDLAVAALELAGVGDSNTPRESGLYHFANLGNVSWHGFATAIRELALELGFEVRAHGIVSVRTSEFPRPAPRPAYSVLDTARVEAALGRPPRPFQTALRDYLMNLEQGAKP